ncbi:acyltransferase family protein [Dyadobacter sp. MSC1_007]|jgi:peptidoglycan/LPS O-acetylase OafA/YrhL|uniref:acyltransferase family protein n=1 Tax=Dyadobacter sp. MSC1_007 TaxID=2909264 RepID=UPI00202E7C73|nr:acyltransferase [Dyadobacter sp. MSC1_007]
MDTRRPQNQIHHFYLLDILRGFASFAVLIWHYQHFFFDKYKLHPGFNRGEQPGYFILKPFYEYGDLAVYLFFILSGFVFFSVYSDGVARRSISLKTFVLNRFSRLYPLHLLTLLLTASLQFGYHQLFNSYFVYEHNDLKHFILQLGLASYWGLQDGHSFNGPIWSVSVEALLYALFFVFCRYVPLRPKYLAIMSLLGLAVGGIHVGAGIFCYFIGGLLYLLFEYQSTNSTFAANKFPAIGVCVAGIAFYPSTFIQHHHPKVYLASMSILPATVYFLAWLQIRFPNCGKSWKTTGDLTYSSYLLHFPLQIVFHGLFHLYGLLNPINGGTLVIFVLITYAFSYLTYQGFELPAKHFFRDWLRRIA